MNGTDIHQLAAAYALDAVDDRERAEYEAHYATCPVCRPEVAGYREALAEVAAAAAITPRDSLKAQVMAEISSTRQLSPLVPEAVVDLTAFRRRHRGTSLTLAAAAVVLLVGATAFLLGRSSGHTDGFAAAATAVFVRPDARVRDLDGTGSGRLKVAWSASAGQVVVIGDGLTDPGEGAAYELWAIDASGAHAVRLLDQADDGRIQRVLKFSGPPMQWAITVEPKEGVDQPTGEVLFAGAA